MGLIVLSTKMVDLTMLILNGELGYEDLSMDLYKEYRMSPDMTIQNFVIK